MKIKSKVFFIILILFAVFFTACNTPTDPGQTPIPTEKPTPPAVEPAQNPIKFALYNGADLYFYDGTNLNLAYTGKIASAGPKALAIGNVLTYFDEYGKSVFTDWLSIEPDLIKVNKTATQQARSLTRSEIFYNDEVWMIEHITPEEAYYELGGLYRDYCIIYHNNVAQNNWWEQQWKPKQIIHPENGMLLAIDSNLGTHNISGTETIFKAYDNGLAIYNVNTTTRHGYMADNEGERYESWGTNYFNGTRWQQADGVWYGDHGYTWSYANGLVENANSMWAMNFQQNYPVFFQLPWANAASIVPAGVLYENGEEVLYWIECNRGTLYKYIHSIDQMQFVIRLYLGDGTRIYGGNQVNIIKPEWYDGCLYFHNDGSIKKYDPTTGIVSIFSEDMEIFPWH